MYAIVVSDVFNHCVTRSSYVSNDCPQYKYTVPCAQVTSSDCYCYYVLLFSLISVYNPCQHYVPSAYYAVLEGQHWGWYDPRVFDP